MKNERKPFDAEAFKTSEGLDIKQREPYDYEYHHAMNPNLTKEVYDYCHRMNIAWKIRCGKKIWRGYGELLLDSAWYLDNEENYRERYRYGRD